MSERPGEGNAGLAALSKITKDWDGHSIEDVLEEEKDGSTS